MVPAVGAVLVRKANVGPGGQEEETAGTRKAEGRTLISEPASKSKCQMAAGAVSTHNEVSFGNAFNKDCVMVSGNGIEEGERPWGLGSKTVVNRQNMVDERVLHHILGNARCDVVLSSRTTYVTPTVEHEGHRLASMARAWQ